MTANLPPQVKGSCTRNSVKRAEILFVGAVENAYKWCIFEHAPSEGAASFH